MKDRLPVQIQSIADKVLPQLEAGETTLEAVLAAHPQQAEELRTCLEAAMWLQAQKGQVDPRRGYVKESKKRLVALLKLRQPATVWQRVWRPHSPQRLAIQTLAVSLLLLSLVLVINTVVLASRLALPGELLYPAKLNVERIQLVLTIDPQVRARLLIEHTQQRTTEIVQLALEDNLSQLPGASKRLENQIGAALVAMERAEEADAAQADGLYAAMSNMLENEIFIMTLLRDMQPSLAYGGLDQAISAANAVLSNLQN